MLTKASSLWYVDVSDPSSVLNKCHDPNPEAALALAEQLHGDREVVPIMPGTLADCAGPDADEVYIGCYPGVTVVCSPRAARVHPTELREVLLHPWASEHTYLVSFDTTHGWGAFAHWERGQFRRSFSSTRVNILEDEGLPSVWERPYWAGEHPVHWPVGDLPHGQILPFDPPEFADAAMNAWLGFHYRSPTTDGTFGPIDIPVCGFSLRPKGRARRAAAMAQPHTPRPGRLLGWLRGSSLVRWAIRREHPAEFS
ncbi:hypothetical protein [Nocardia sp. CNY236]|uniref:DUF6928 family protein n=1 Tax=Nocardia sp. CNY236 TaxID=1169152 RepID=UPI000683FEFF|nr:hypothetical protein [Nocardia sp. CNY236]